MRPTVLATLAALLALPPAVLGEPTGEELLRLDGTTISVAEIEERIPQLMAAVWLPGMSVTVVRDGAIAYRQSFGVRDAGSGTPVTPGTSFTGLSFSKTITAYLVMRLVEQGVVDLDRPLHTYLAQPLPEYEDYSDLEGETRHLQLTARHVLSHTTGWPNWRFFTDSGTLHFLFDPGARHSYSGEGFAYLQRVLEELTGKDFAQLAREEVFDPLDMAHSSMVWEESFEADFAEDHDLLGRPIGRQKRDRPSAAGSLQTTIGDYTRFVIAVMAGQGLAAPSRDLLLAPQVALRHARMFGPRLYEETSEHTENGLSWTLGWGRVTTPFGPAIFHTGNDRGSANYAIAFPEERAAVVLMGNSNRLEGIAEDVVELLTADRSSPFEFLGYARWDEPVQNWLRTLAEGGLEAGRAYWESLGPLRETHGLDQDDIVAAGADVLAHFGRTAEALDFHRWRRETFPESAAAARALVRALLETGESPQAQAALDAALAAGLDLEWFAAWARALAAPAAVPPERLSAFAGDYEVRRFELREGRLFYGRDGAPSAEYRELIAMGEETFVLEAFDFFRLRFEVGEDGRATRVHGLYEDGGSDSNERTED